MRFVCLTAAAALMLACGVSTSAPATPVVAISTPATYTAAPTVPLEVTVGLEPDRVELLRAGRLEAVLAPPYRHTWDTANAPEGVTAWTARARIRGVWVESPPLEITIDRTPASATASPSGAGTVQKLDAVEIAFSEPVSVTGAGSGFEVVPALRGAAVACEATWSVDRSRVTLTPSRPLSSPDTVAVRVTGAVSDRAGNVSASLPSWSIALASPWELVGGASPTESDTWPIVPDVFLIGGALHVTSGSYPSPVARLAGGRWEGAAAGPSGDLGFFLAEYATDGARVWAAGTNYETKNAGIAQWDGTRWNAVGAPLRVDPQAQILSTPLLGFDGQQAIAVWYEPVLDASSSTLRAFTRVARWTGSEWAVVTSLAATYPYDIISTSAGAYVALSNGVEARIGRVRGGAWELLPALPSVFSAALAATADGQRVYAAGAFWEELYGCRVYEWNGAAWRKLGDATSPGNVTSPCDVVAGSGLPVVAWSTAKDGSDPKLLHVAQWDGTRFVEPWGILNLASERDAGTPALAVDPTGVPVVAWSEQVAGTYGVSEDYARYRVFVKRLRQ